MRGVLSKAAAKAVTASSPGGSLRVPADQDTKVATVDLSHPSEADQDPLFLSRAMRAEIEDFVSTIEQRDRLQARGIEIPARLLLHGPPGTGKTSIARHVAARLQLPLVTTRSDTLVSSLLGQTSRNIREVFDYASRWPCVLFLDEFDALAKNRADVREVGELQRVVIALLENLDSFGGTNVLIAATNHPQLLDTAIWRRFDHTMATSLPIEPQRRDMWRQALSVIDVSEPDLITLARLSAGLPGSAIRVAALDIARAEVFAHSEKLRLPHALQRLAKYLTGDVRWSQEDLSEEVRTLRAWEPSVFTIRSLSEVFNVSTRQITNHLKETSSARAESDPSASVHPE